MVFTKHKLFAPAVLTTCLLVFSASPILAQDTTNPAGSRTVVSGEKMNQRGIDAARDADQAQRAYIREAAGTASSPAEQLSKLVDLHERGKIDDAEFAKAKTAILG